MLAMKLTIQPKIESNTEQMSAADATPAIRLHSRSLALAVLLCTAAGGSSAQDLDARVSRLETYLGDCTQKHGYDPDAANNVGEHEIAPGEANWRNCAYEGIRNIMIPGSAAAGAYRYLIAFDRTLTQQIESGKLTRDKRKERLQKAIDDALAQDQAASGGRTAEESARNEAEVQAERNEMVRRSREAQKLREIQSMMR